MVSEGMQSAHCCCSTIVTLSMHYEIWKYCQSTSKVHASVLQNLRVQCGVEPQRAGRALEPVSMIAPNETKAWPGMQECGAGCEATV